MKFFSFSNFTERCEKITNKRTNRLFNRTMTTIAINIRRKKFDTKGSSGIQEGNIYEQINEYKRQNKIEYLNKMYK